METQDNRGLMLSPNLSIAKIAAAEQGLRIQDATIKQIREVLAKIFALIGLPPNRIPNALEQQVLEEYMRDNVSHRLEEIILAFNLVLTGKFDYELNLFGEPFSVKYLAGLLKAYDQFKLSEKREAILKAKQSEVKMSNSQRLGAIAALLKKDTLKAIEDIGKRKESPVSQTSASQITKRKDDHFQNWMRQFDELHKKRPAEEVRGSGRFIRRYGKMLNIEGYVEYKLYQMKLAKERYTDVL